MYIHVSHCQPVAKFFKDYKCHTVPARRDCIFIIALYTLGTYKYNGRVCHLEVLGHTLTGIVVCSTTRCCYLARRMRPHPVPLGYIIHIAYQSRAVQLI